MKLFGRSRRGPPSTTTVRTDPDPKDIEILEELQTHIEVCARIRPLVVNRNTKGYFSTPRRRVVFPKRQESGPPVGLTDRVAWHVSEDAATASQAAHTNPHASRTSSYTLDRVYRPDTTTRFIYRKSIYSLVRRAMEGYHASILAYGQTSTGKTYTMSGTKEAPGLVPLSIADCFQYVKESQESREYLIRLSYLEVYKEHIRDLLASTPKPIRLFDGPSGLVIRGLKEEVVATPEEVFSILKKGEARRQVGATNMNLHSSRSHVMVRLWVESSPLGGGKARVSSLSLVDLAGSESVRLNGTDRREEGKYINQSLMTLGQVVLSLSEGKKGHIPYRDSKLTRLLQPSLSGNAQMVLLCCISPRDSHLEESHNTFKFATRAKHIEQKASVTVEEETLLQNYRTEIKDLKQQLADAQSHETGELVDAIKTMERLILKSQPHAVEEEESEIDLLAENDDDNDNDDDDDDDDDPQVDEKDNEDNNSINLLADEENEAEQPKQQTPSTPKSPQEALASELTRIRGLLGSVLKQRTPQSIDGKVLTYATPEEEAATLRKKVQEEQVTTNLRKADASFLQSQLREKNALLEEVSALLEAVEKRQADLEKENATLRLELEMLKGGARGETKGMALESVKAEDLEASEA